MLFLRNTGSPPRQVLGKFAIPLLITRVSSIPCTHATIFGQAGQPFGQEDYTWNAVAAPDDVHDALDVTFNRSAKKTVRRIATVHTVDVVF